MAEAGGQPRDGTDKYYKANSLEELNQALEKIGGMVIDCSLTLVPPPEFPHYLWVYFDGVLVPKKTDQNPEGWEYDNENNQLVFSGSYCDQLRQGQVDDLEVKMGCKPPD